MSSTTSVIEASPAPAAPPEAQERTGEGAEAARSGASCSDEEVLGAATVETLVARTASRLGGESQLSLTRHLRAAKDLVALRVLLEGGERLSEKASMRLLCAGIHMHRRGHVGDCGGEETAGPGSGDGNSGLIEERKRKANEELSDLVKTTSVLIFVLLAMAEVRHGATSGTGPDSALLRPNAARVLAESAELRLEDGIADPPPPYCRPSASASDSSRKRKAPDDALDVAPETDEDRVARAAAEELRRQWEARLRPSVAYLAKQALYAGADLCATEGQEPPEQLETLKPLARTFFRASQARMAQEMVLPEGDRDLSSLSFSKTARMSDAERECALRGIAQCGESEAGQSALRDLLLSFILPQRLVGVRRALVLPRGASTEAGVDFSAEVQRAHDCAMAGADFLWQNGTNEIERICCLLSGLAILMTKATGSDAVRKADAFAGRVLLPFLEAEAPAPKALRLMLVPHYRRWVLFFLDPKTGRPSVVHSERGFVGFCNCALHLLEDLKQAPS